MTKEEYYNRRDALEAMDKDVTDPEIKHSIAQELVKLQNKWRATAKPEERRYIYWTNKNGDKCSQEILP